MKGSRHLSWPCCDFHLRPPGWHFTGLMIWVREQDLNLRFSTYEADEDNRTPLSRIKLSAHWGFEPLIHIPA